MYFIESGILLLTCNPRAAIYFDDKRIVYYSIKQQTCRILRKAGISLRKDLHFDEMWA